MKKVIAAGFGLCFAGAAFAGHNSCYLAHIGICVESSTIDLSGNCASHGGTFGLTCPTEDRVGSCEVKTDEGTLTARYYPKFGENPEANCKENKGTYVPG